MLVLEYDSLKADLGTQLRKLSDFLKVKVTDEDIQCTIALQEGLHHRKTENTDRLEELKAIFGKNRLLKLVDLAKETENTLKTRFNRDFDVGRGIQKHILQSLNINSDNA